MTYSAMAEDVLHFLRKHQLKNVSLLGHSMGGKVAMTVALNYNLPDGLLENLIVEDTAPAAGAQLTEFPGYIKGMRAVNAAEVTTRKEATDILAKGEKDPAILQFLLTNLELPPRVEHAQFKIPLDILEGYTNSMGDFPYAPGERQWSGRTLFIRGTKSKYMNERNIQVVQKMFPSMQLTELPAGHWVHSERPQDFRKVVSQFIGPMEPLSGS
ncbi:alpha/beta-hydrolase [Schizophyllum commune H4-8]